MKHIQHKKILWTDTYSGDLSSTVCVSRHKIVTRQTFDLYVPAANLTV